MHHTNYMCMQGSNAHGCYAWETVAWAEPWLMRARETDKRVDVGVLI